MQIKGLFSSNAFHTQLKSCISAGHCSAELQNDKDFPNVSSSANTNTDIWSLHTHEPALQMVEEV